MAHKHGLGPNPARWRSSPARHNELCRIAINELADEDCRGVSRSGKAAAHACKGAPQNLVNHFMKTEAIKRASCGLDGLGRTGRRGKKRRR